MFNSFVLADDRIDTDLSTPKEPPCQDLVSMADARDYRQGLAAYLSGKWLEEWWTTFRLRFGVYGQKQAGKHMIRAKIPGGRLSFEQARSIACANRLYAGSDVHVTTRQDVQFYFVGLEQTESLISELVHGGVTTREAAGNTFRNIVACPHAGICPQELVDAGIVAEQLSRTWIRHPLVQHMPRKFKTTISGCAHDCGYSKIDDLGLIATVKGGISGFRVFLGGGLGIKPHTAIEVLDFVQEEDLPAVQEVAARLHHALSNRKRKAASRIKFVVMRYGEEEIRTRFQTQFNAVRRRKNISPWEPLAWKNAKAKATPPPTTFKSLEQPDGRVAVMVRLPLGMIDSDRLEALTRCAEQWHARELRLTRNQNIVVVGILKDNVQSFIKDMRDLGFDIDQAQHTLGDVVACPGSSTCPIGITNADGFVRELLAHKKEFINVSEVCIRVSGCHNSCGQHHIGDFGLHGSARKVNGARAPHYTFHLGGNPQDGLVGIEGPTIPARQAICAMAALINHYQANHLEGESVRAWALRLGSNELEKLVEPSQGVSKNDAVHIDWGEGRPFSPPGGVADCAAPAAIGEYMADLAHVAFEDACRAFANGEMDTAIEAKRLAALWAGRRLLLIKGRHDADTADVEDMIANIKTLYADDKAVQESLTHIIPMMSKSTPCGSGIEYSLRRWLEDSQIAVERYLETLT